MWACSVNQLDLRKGLCAGGQLQTLGNRLTLWYHVLWPPSGSASACHSSSGFENSWG